jgi:alcohol dehydrogenase class IV
VPFANFQVSTRVTFGPGALAAVGVIAKEGGLRRVLIVTDAGVVKAGIPRRVCEELAHAGVEGVIFDAVEANPSVETVDRVLETYQTQSCQGLLAVGGGSPMDAAKAAGALATNPGRLLDYVGIGKFPRPLPPLVAIPTTTGTGSEVTPFAIITDHAQRRKVVIGSPLMAPLHALLDPSLVANLPTGLLAATAMDALTHATESVISVFASPFSDSLALEAIRMISANLRKAVGTAALESRANLLYASTMAGMAFSYARVGLVHGMAHPLSAYYDVPHGLANAILLPHVLAYNTPTCETALCRVAQALGEPPTSAAAISAIRKLGADVGIPANLAAVGVTPEFIPEMSQDAFQSGNAQVVNPRKPTLDDIVGLYEQAL